MMKEDFAPAAKNDDDCCGVWDGARSKVKERCTRRAPPSPCFSWARVSPVTDVHQVSLHVEASSLTQDTIESALARFVRDCLRSVRAVQIFHRPTLAAPM